MKSNLFQNCRILFFALTCAILASTTSALADSATETNVYWAIPFASEGPIVYRYGVPFMEKALSFQSNNTSHSSVARLSVGGPVKRIFVSGMTDTGKAHSWTTLGNYSRRYFIGDHMGIIRLNYVDGSAQVYPLTFGESLWWGEIFYNNPEPFSIDSKFREALRDSLRLYPPQPVQDGNYVAVITPQDGEISEILVQNNSGRIGVPVITGITVEAVADRNITYGKKLIGLPLDPGFAKFAEEKPLCQTDEETNKNLTALENLKRAFYVSDEDFKGPVEPQKPPGYTGPSVSFSGNIYATILANSFHYTVQDMRDKVDNDGMYHTSTRGAPNWGLYSGFGTYAKNVGYYYNDSRTRDLGRSLMELTALGFTNEAQRCADYCLQMSRLWSDPSNAINGQILPPHWGGSANRLQSSSAFDNDGHGLTAMFIYQLWQRLPNRDEWLRARWPDVKAAGDWILWQFEHPELSGATNDILFTTSEAASTPGNSIYADYTCMNALRALAEMAYSINEAGAVVKWRTQAGKMRSAMAREYIAKDKKYGNTWTLNHAGWPNKSSVLGPLILLADYEGFAPENDDPQWRPFNQAAYQRLIESYKPFGFYGQAMGYGQGFAIQSALLLDEMSNATLMLDWAAKEIYDPRVDSYIVPEACDIDSTGHYWYRIGDLGSGVQEAEMIKALRLVIGIDDTQPDRLQFFPRMPRDWNSISVSNYPVVFDNSGKITTTRLHYKLVRDKETMKLVLRPDKTLGTATIRMGPFESKPDSSNVFFNGKHPANATVVQSGDSWWVAFSAVVESNE